MAHKPSDKQEQDRRAANRRSSPRADVRMPAMIYLDGKEWHGGLVNLSAGGAMVETTVQLAAGQEFAMGIFLDQELQSITNVDFLHFDLAVVDAVERPSRAGNHWRYRCRNLTNEGSPQFRRASQIVYKNMAA